MTTIFTTDRHGNQMEIPFFTIQPQPPSLWPFPLVTVQDWRWGAHDANDLYRSCSVAPAAAMTAQTCTAEHAFSISNVLINENEKRTVKVEIARKNNLITQGQCTPELVSNLWALKPLTDTLKTTWYKNLLSFQQLRLWQDPLPFISFYHLNMRQGFQSSLKLSAHALCTFWFRLWCVEISRPWSGSCSTVTRRTQPYAPCLCWNDWIGFSSRPLARCHSATAQGPRTTLGRHPQIKAFPWPNHGSARSRVKPLQPENTVCIDTHSLGLL